MSNKEVERLNKYLMPYFEIAKKKYKGKSPTLIFTIKNQGTHRFVGFGNENDGKFEGDYHRYSLLDKWFRGSEDFTLKIKFDKKVQSMKDLKLIIKKAVKNATKN
jgi:hypothetical protein